MIGAIRSAFASHRRLYSALFLASETAASTLCFRAIIDTWPHFAMALPYVAFVVPVLAGFAIGNFARSRISNWKLAAAILLAVSFVFVAFNAGFLAQFSSGSSFVAVAFHPWTVKGRIPSDVSTLAWVLTWSLWARGLIVGLGRGSYRQAIRSARWTFLVFFVIFITSAADHAPVLRHAVRGDEILFLIAFFLAIPAVRLARKGDVEKTVTATQGSPVTVGWITMLGLPVVVLGVVSVLFAVFLVAFGTDIASVTVTVAHGVARAIIVVGRGILFALEEAILGVIFVIREIVGLFVHINDKTSKAGTIKQKKSPPHKARLPQIPVGYAVATGLAMLSAVAFLLVRHRPRKQKPPAPTILMPALNESMFTWRHLFLICFRFMKRVIISLFSKLRRRPLLSSSVSEDVFGVRAEYRKFLVAAARQNLPRSSVETPREYEKRVGVVLAENGSKFRALTDNYELVRYGEVDEAVVDESNADQLVAALEALSPED